MNHAQRLIATTTPTGRAPDPRPMSQPLHLIFPLTRLHCQDGIASHLATLLPRLQDCGVRIITAVGMVDVPRGTEHVLERIKNGSNSFEVDERLLVKDKRLDSKTLYSQVNALRHLIGRANALGRDSRYVIHLQGRGLGPAVRIASGLRKSLVFTSQLSLGLKPIERPSLGGRLRAWAVADRAIAISRELAQELNEVESHPSKNIRLIFHGVDSSRFTPVTPDERQIARQRLGIENDRFVIGMLARIAAVKRHDTLISAFESLLSQQRAVHLVIAGEGAAELVEALRQKLGVPQFAGKATILGYADARDVIWACDATVLPSEREGFGISVCESMACGVVPLRTPVEGARDQIQDGRTGFLFPVGDAGRLAEQLAYLMDHPAERRAMGAAAAQFAREQFSADVMAEKTLAVYRELAFGEAPDPRTLLA